MKRNKTDLSALPVVLVLTLVCCLLWGSAFPAIKKGYELFGIASGDSSSQILFAGLRFTLAGILAALLGSAGAGRWLVPGKGSLPRIGVLAMFQTILQYTFFYLGLARTTGMKSSVINGSQAFICILTAVYIFRQEKMTLRKLAGCLLGFAGVVIVNLGGSTEGGIHFSGEGLILLSAVSYSFSVCFTKRFSKHDDPVMLSSYQFILGGLVMTAAGFAMGGKLGSTGAGGVLILLYLAFVSAAAFSLWGLLLKYNPVSRISVFGFMTPVSGVVLSALFLSETQSGDWLKMAVSLVLVALGIIIVNISKSAGK